jgi:hypothetical protein
MFDKSNRNNEPITKLIANEENTENNNSQWEDQKERSNETKTE